MPARDKTGPTGQGPGTGRGAGPCVPGPGCGFNQGFSGGCGRGRGMSCGCGRRMCCGWGMSQGFGFGRMFWTQKDQQEELEAYRDGLKKELEAVESALESDQ